MELIGTIVIGFIVGLLARAVKPGNDNLGIIWTTVLGIAGSLLATYIGQSMGLYHVGEVAGWVASIVGAIVLLFIVQMIKRKS